MDKAHKPSISESCMPSSEPFRFYQWNYFAAYYREQHWPGHWEEVEARERHFTRGNQLQEPRHLQELSVTVAAGRNKQSLHDLPCPPQFLLKRYYYIGDQNRFNLQYMIS
jgi:hypothetical protein